MSDPRVVTANSADMENASETALAADTETTQDASRIAGHSAISQESRTQEDASSKAAQKQSKHENTKPPRTSGVTKLDDDTSDAIAAGLKSALLPLAAALEEASGQVTQSQLLVAADIDRLEVEIEKFMKNYTLPSDCEQQLRKLESFKQRLNTVVHRMSGVQNRIDNMTYSIDKTSQRRKWQLGGFSM